MCPVSYTHLDVYKRQTPLSETTITSENCYGTRCTTVTSTVTVPVTDLTTSTSPSNSSPSSAPNETTEPMEPSLESFTSQAPKTDTEQSSSTVSFGAVSSISIFQGVASSINARSSTIFGVFLGLISLL